jgi:hypothetical protein
MSFLKNLFGQKGEPMPSEPIFPGESFTIFKLDFPDGCPKGAFIFELPLMRTRFIIPIS